MKKSTIIVGLLAATVLVGVMLSGRSTEGVVSSPAESAVKSALSAPNTLYDFGVILMKDGNVAHRFTVTNPTDKDLMVERLSTSCMCTTAYIIEGASRNGPFGMAGMGYGTKIKMIFKPRESKDVEVVFDPNAHGPAGVGPMQRFVHLTDAAGGKLQLEIRGLVKP